MVHHDGKPVGHTTVERAYEKLRAIIQMYVLHRQEDRIVLWPLLVLFRPIGHRIHYIHTAACCGGLTLHIHATPVAHHQLCMCRTGDQVRRCLTGGPRTQRQDSVRRVRVGPDIGSQDMAAYPHTWSHASVHPIARHPSITDTHRGVAVCRGLSRLGSISHPRLCMHMVTCNAGGCVEHGTPSRCATHTD